MPTWDYQCELCEYVTEMQWRNLAEALEKEKFYTCPNCDGEGILHRLPSAPAFTITGFNSKNNYSRG